MPQAVCFVALCSIDIIFGEKNCEYELQEVLHVRNHARFTNKAEVVWLAETTRQDLNSQLTSVKGHKRLLWLVEWLQPCHETCKPAGWFCSFSTSSILLVLIYSWVLPTKPYYAISDKSQLSFDLSLSNHLKNVFLINYFHCGTSVFPQSDTALQ